MLIYEFTYQNDDNSSEEEVRASLIPLIEAECDLQRWQPGTWELQLQKGAVGFVCKVFGEYLD